MNEEVRRLRPDLLNQVNHIVGYAELAMEEAEDAGDASPLAALEEIRSAGKLVMTEVTRLLDPASADGVDGAELARALAEPLDRVGDLAAGLEADRIAIAAARARELAAGVHPEPGLGSRVPPTAASETPKPDGATRGLVLVVDDDEFNRDVLARRLSRLGYGVIQAPNGRLALEVMASEPVDLVLLDLNMPELDGYGVLECQHQDPQLRDIPTIMISASADIDSVVRCIQMGAEDHLGKPFDPVLLEARVGACLEKKRLRDQERALLETVSRQAEALAEWNETLERRVADQVDELEQLARLRRFLSRQLADVLAKGQGEDILRTHRRDIAVLFVDLSGFTAFAELSEPEDVMAVLAEFHEDVGELVDQFEATVGFLAGDGVMVFWNDPLPCPDPAERAVRMAVALRERSADRIRAWRKRGHDLGFSIGVSLGYATLGEMGFEGRYDYGVIGSVVNLAARLCDRAERGQILISSRTRLATEDIAVVEELEPTVLKGFHAPVPAFAVLDLRDPAGAPGP